MAVGLTKDSPVQLSLSKANYTALIDRHGQWMRWRIAEKCSCVKGTTMQPDIHCPHCAGRGYTYTYLKNQIVFNTVMLFNKDGILELENTLQIKQAELLEVYDQKGKKYPTAKKNCNYIYLNTTNIPEKGTYFTVVLRQKLVVTLESAIAEKGNMGYYTVPGLLNSKTNIEGVYYSAPSDIINIAKITDAAGIEYKATEYRLNQFRIVPTVDPDTHEEIAITEPVTVENVEYIPPFIFVLLSQNLSKGDAKAVEESSGDAVCSFPYECDVSDGDILTVLAGSYTQKDVICRSQLKTDTIGADFVYDIVSVKGIIDGEEVEYEQGTDYILVGTNKIKWLDESELQPETGDAYSITYHIMPTYRVVKQIPQIRTSENQRFPKKVVVKLFAAYAEKAGVNKQKNTEITKKGIDSSF
jgi:hypothetical protein